ncbi:MAG: penicillin-binding transpeptidase domain-containing protein [Roseburia faecis]|uniref:penicillin-binding transpeptidase domain-containing protein n=1 Tax=Roseburia faecis TaxID=301302 RepID=UPI001B1DB6A3|nr:peptidoglycan glycosyltransferase [Agathobacter sp.]MDY6278512.1 penicillin-binding transpeptidase domain-containing protein [Roseburia faecis]
MSYDIKDFLKKFFSSRLFVLAAVFIVFFGIILARIFTLQVVNGKSYQENFSLKIQMKQPINAARGNIYDKNGKLLAYNELAYSISINDSTTYSSTKEKNKAVNAELAEILTVLKNNGETLNNDFKIDRKKDGTYSFNVSGSSLNRFRADVFGKSSADDLEYDKDTGIDEANATAEQIMEYLMGKDNFGISSKYDGDLAYRIVVVRYAMLGNRFARYKEVKIAADVSDKTVAYVNEHMDTLSGISVNEDMIRKYNYSEYFSSIIGYTGPVSESEYTALHKKNKDYTQNDTVGKAGMEQYYETYLRGKNGEQKFYIDNVGRISEIISSTDSVAGDDLYLSIDADLQKATYLALQNEIAAIVYSNIKSGEIPINDVYTALIGNSVINTEHFSKVKASDTEKNVLSVFKSRQKTTLGKIKQELTSSPEALNTMSDEVLDEFTYIISMLKDDQVLLKNEIDTSDSVYQKWKNQKISPKEYLSYCITQHWIDISQLNVDEKYADSTEVYDALCKYILKNIKTDTEFSKIIYQYMITRGEISPRQLCLILFDQGVLDYDDATVNKLKNGSLSPRDFLMKKIYNIEITPAQLALEPCTGSCVVTDEKTGEILAMVSYPGYDSNKLANGVDSEYFASLQHDKSSPLLNYATQQKTAPGSTFKLVSATAGLAENVITTSDQIRCTGIYNDISNKPKCWIYPGSHGLDNVSEAIRDSCNVFFYTVGNRLAQKKTGSYNDANGIDLIQKYAHIYGLDQKTGLEISESKSSVATKYPVMAAIGQSDNNYTTVALSRYVTAVASGKKYNYQLMNKIVDADGKTVKKYKANYEDISDTLTSSQWDAIHSGMREVVSTMDRFQGFDIPVAGKTGTAQQTGHANHGLFVGYAPYDDPEITIAVRIANGYSSHNAATAARNVISYYYKETSMKDIKEMKAAGANGNIRNSVAD